MEDFPIIVRSSTINGANRSRAKTIPKRTKHDSMIPHKSLTQENTFNLNSNQIQKATQTESEEK